METQTELFNSTNIAVLAAATAAIEVVTIALYHLFKLKPKWTAFVSSLLIAAILVIIADQKAWYDWVIGFFNACLLYCTALGLNETAVKAVQGPGTLTAKTKGFFMTWL